MVGYLFRKMLRDMRKGAASYIVAAVIVMTGFAGYSVMSIAADQLEDSKDYFFEKTNFCDAFAEVQEAPASAVKELERIEGISRAQARLVKTARVAGLP